MVRVDDRLKEGLRKAGVSTLHAGALDLPDDSTFETPCSLKWMRADHSLYVGAFSYAVSGYYFATRIGRYVSIGEDVQVGRGSHPVRWASTSPLFYQRYQEALDLKLEQATHHYTNSPYIAPKDTNIGNDVYIGHGAFLIQGVSVGDGAVIGACSVVTKDVPPFAIVAGNPAKVKSMRFDDGIIEKMIKLRWWDYAFWDLSGAPVAEPEAFLEFVAARISTGIKPYRPKVTTIKTLLALDSSS
jgi:acetyltransferase-like isoleucine patch superfamily enzyme